MNDRALFEAGLFKLVVVVAGIVVAMFFMTSFVGLAFMPSQLISGMASEDITFLWPMAFATICSAIVLGFYVRSHMSRSKKQSLTHSATQM